MVTRFVPVIETDYRFIVFRCWYLINDTSDRYRQIDCATDSGINSNSGADLDKELNQILLKCSLDLISSWNSHCYFSADDTSNAVPKNGGKIFRCRSCPFATDQVFRLQKHENKHLVKSEHQVSVV